MSVTATFLRGGHPWTAHRALREGYSTRTAEPYPTWIVVACWLRRWATDLRENSYMCPGFVLFFGTTSATHDDDSSPSTAAGDDLSLFYYAPVHLLATSPSTSLAVADRVMEAVHGVLKQVPDTLRPQRMFVSVDASSTHERIGLLDPQAIVRFLTQLVLSSDGGSTTPRLPPHTTVYGSRQPCAQERVVLDAAEWCANQHASLHATELPRLHCAEAWLQAVYSSRMDSDGHDMRMVLANRIACQSIVVHQGGDGAAAVSRKRPSRWISFSVAGASGDMSSSSAGAVHWRHGAAVQPRDNSRVISPDGIVTGLLQPAPSGPTIHLHVDVGDVLFARRAMFDAELPVDCYDDLLPVEGEIQIQFGPVEGVPFDDLDVILDFLGVKDNADERLVSLQCMSSLSCSRLAVPRVAHRKPLGTVVRATPVSDPTMQVDAVSLKDDVVTRDALHAVETLLRCAVQDDLVTSSSDVMSIWERTMSPLEVERCLVACTWCGRQREKLMRCGGCKAACYCCKTHQANDWRGSHKSECPLWRQAALEYNEEIKRHVSSSQTSESSAVITTGAAMSNVETLVALLPHVLDQYGSTAASSRRRAQDTFVVHIIANSMTDDLISPFLQCLSENKTASRISTMLTSRAIKHLRVLLCSTALTEARRNEVYRITSKPSEPHRMECAKVKNTGVLGDMWHEHPQPVSHDVVVEEEEDMQTTVWLRLYSERYHNFLARQSTSLHPDAVFALGDDTGSGMSFFTAAAEVIAEDYIGSVPVVCTEPSLIAAHRSLLAIQQRLGTVSSDAKRISPTICINAVGFDRKPLEAVLHSAAAASAGSSTVKNPVPLHRNLYYFVC